MTIVTSEFVIYIPLWSYSNLLTCRHYRFCILFTFHYGPIQIDSIKERYDSIEIFTFHYGPIQIVLHFFISILKKNLHSTMVLFKWAKNVNVLLDHRNLHSTMVLFKFPYFVDRIYLFRYLHSTMVLFK